ncbi:DDE superfamily endonuclease [Paenibacillus sophorae]|uniref:DDE superfamily endonuclease n=2 Tax=Paenibacillus sophorae TaxID=1333845 RepID=A0A1H8VBW4_9BACL|nr:DDE superfamily endonuclease [Paenibacillus sophorae]SEP12889.1 DDE superfamily endonuclease [Paenibacillus sophorae]
MPTRKVRNSMLQQHSLSEQSRFSKLFATLQIGKSLRNAGISKSFGLSSLAVFQIVFSLVFEGKNWFRLLESQRGTYLPGKDVVYRFLNHPSFAWRKFLHTLSFRIVSHFESLISSSRVRVFIIDDSVLSRNRSKKAELLARVFDHTTGKFTKGYTLLTLGWSDGFSFAPLDFVMLSSAKLANRICEMTSKISKRSMGYKRRMESFSRKPDAVVSLLERALAAGFTADYVLMDSWFTQAPLLRQLTDKGLSVIGMVKEMKQRYLVQGQRMTLREVFQSLPKSSSKDIKGSMSIHTTCGLPVKLVFVRNRNKRREWLAILSTDVSLDSAEIVRIYGMRWNIETFFKVTKSYLKLGTEFQGRSFDQLISHTTIVFSRYLAMEYERRQASDDRTLGGLFFLFADEVRDLNFQTALQQLMILFLEMAQAKTKKNQTSVFCQLQDWISSLPSYIKGLFKDLSCES